MRRHKIAAGVMTLALGAGLAPWSVAFGKGEKDRGAAADPGVAGERIGLRDALKLAVRQNPKLASETIDVAIADAQIRGTYGLDEFQVEASANWSSSRSEGSGDFFRSQSSDRLDLAAGLTKPLSTGGSVGLKFDGSYQDVTPNIPGLDPYTTYSPALTVTFFQPLLRGFGEKTKYSGRSKAKIDRTVQDIERENSAGSTVQQVVAAYWDLAFAAEELKIRRQSLALAQEQARITRALVDGGKVARTENAAVEQIIAEREEAVFLAEQAISDSSIVLRQIVGMEIGPAAIDLVAVDRLSTDMPLPDLDKTLAAALEQNPQLRVLREQAKGAAIDVEVGENGLLPQLDFTASGGPAGNADNIGDSLEQVGTFKSYQFSAGVKYTTSIGNDAAKARVEAAQGSLRKVKMTESDVRAQVAVGVVRTINQIKAAKKRLETAQKGSKLAVINIDAEKVRWEQGRSTNFNVLQRQDELAQAQLREARAQADYLKLMAQLETLTGEILRRYGIELTAN
jgi:outer membrane protein TolC